MRTDLFECEKENKTGYNSSILMWNGDDFESIYLELKKNFDGITKFIVRFDYWEVRPNELLHHHGFLANMERVYAPSLRMDKEIEDVFEYMLLRSGRLILHPSDDRRSIILDNVPFVNKKEETITRMLGALQVEVRENPNR